MNINIIQMIASKRQDHYNLLKEPHFRKNPETSRNRRPCVRKPSRSPPSSRRSWRPSRPTSRTKRPTPTSSAKRSSGSRSGWSIRTTATTTCTPSPCAPSTTTRATLEASTATSTRIPCRPWCRLCNRSKSNRCHSKRQSQTDTRAI